MAELGGGEGRVKGDAEKSGLGDQVDRCWCHVLEKELVRWG